MAISVTILTAGLFFYLIAPTCVLGLVEYFLARLESPWPGRILPILSAAGSVCTSLLLLLNLVGGAPFPTLLIPLVSLVILNIPTAVFLVVCHYTRRKYVQKKNLDKMNIQDL